MQMLNPTTSLLSRVNKIVEEKIRALPKSILVRVVLVKKNTVNVSSIDLKASTPTIISNVPIMRPIYNHYPIKIGDIGVCLTIDYSVEPLLKNSKTPKKPLQKNAEGSGYFFFPFASLDNDMATDTMANEMYSLDGKTQFIIDNLKVELRDRFNNDIVVDEKGIKITDANKNEIVINSEGIKITDLNKNEAVLDSSGAQIEDANSNKVEMASSGIKITDANSNSVEMSSSGITVKDSAGNSIETASASVTIKNSSCKIELGAAGVNINNGALEIMP